MTKYQVKLKETVTYLVEVDAKDGYAAQELAAEVWAQSEDPFGDFSGSGEGVEPVWFDPLEPEATDA